MLKFFAQLGAIFCSMLITLYLVYLVVKNRPDLKCGNGFIWFVGAALVLYSSFAWISALMLVPQSFPPKTPRIEYRYPPGPEMPPGTRSLSDMQPVAVFPDGTEIWIDKKGDPIHEKNN